MLRIVLSLCFIFAFAFAERCDFSDSTQTSCELSIDNPPIFLHKLVDEDGNMKFAHAACIEEGQKVRIYDEEYDVINCALVSDDSMETEGVIIANTLDFNTMDSAEDMNHKLTTNRFIELESNNILLRVAGELVIDSGIRINTKKKKFIVEMIRGTNGYSNITLRRGAGLYGDMIIMPKGEKSNISLNTFFGGVYEKDFISLIENKNPAERGNMETIIDVGNIYSINRTGDEVNSYDGNIACGPEIDPLDIENRDYVVKRLYNVKNTSKDAPNASNSVCNVESADCFGSINTYKDVKVYGRSYKIATSNLGADIDVSPIYDVFIESGKIISNNKNATEVLSNANFMPRNYGLCGAPNKLTFEIPKAVETIAQDDTEEYIQEQDEELESSAAEETGEIAVEQEIPESTTQETQVTTGVAAQTPTPKPSEIVAPVIIAPTQIDDDFLLVEEKAFKHFRSICNGDLSCLYNGLLPYSGVVWDKMSSKNKKNSIVVVNFTNDNLEVSCDVPNYYEESLHFDYKLNSGNRIGKIDLVFPKSNNTAKITCKSNKNIKTTNNIRVTPARFTLNPNFENKSFNNITTIYAGTNKIIFDDAKALTLENELDTGFNGELMANYENITFTQKNQCNTQSDKITIGNPIIIKFTNGKINNNSAVFNASMVTNGKLNIDFRVNDNGSNLCSDSNNSLEPQCISANLSADIDIIPANFMIKTDIVSNDSIAYYGQIDDRNSFKYNPLLSVKITPVDNNKQPIEINQECNYGYIQLTLKSDKLIEFKRNTSDRLGSNINIYLSDFEKNTASLDVYFGIAKILDSYKNVKKIGQGDVVESQEIKLTDLNFNARFRSNDRFYNYDDIIVYDRLDENSNPQSVLIARGKIEPSSVYGDNKQGSLLVAKYLIFCETCDVGVLSKYLHEDNPEMDSPNWYVNTKHPEQLYIDSDFIKTNLRVQNSNKALEGRQQILFAGDESGIFDVAINQSSVGFAPYLNYNSDFKGVYIPNSFKVIVEAQEKVKEPEKMAAPVIKPKKEEEQKKEVPKIAKPAQTKPAPKAATPVAKSTQSSVQLDIED